MSVSEAFEVVLLDEKTLDEIEEPVKDFEILDLNAANANDSGNSGKNAIGQAHDMFSRVFQNTNLRIFLPNIISSICFDSLKCSKLKKKWVFLQVNLCQKLLFLHQLTHNMTTDCS